MKRLLTKWPGKVKYRGTEFGSGAFGPDGAQIAQQNAQQQQTLFDMLCAVKKENMRVEIERDPLMEGLKLVIRISG